MRNKKIDELSLLEQHKIYEMFDEAFQLLEGAGVSVEVKDVGTGTLQYWTAKKEDDKGDLVIDITGDDVYSLYYFARGVKGMQP